MMAHAVLVQFFTYAFRPATSYAALDAGASPALLGLLGAVFAVPALMLALPSGHVVDRVGERLTALLGGALLLAAGITALLGLRSLPALVVATFLLGCGHLLSVVSEQALVANRSNAGSRESAFGLYTFVVSIGQTAGPLLIAVPAPDGTGPDLELIFAVSTGIAIAITVSGVFLPPTRSASAAPIGMTKSAVDLLRRRGVLRALLSSSLALASVDITLAYWPALGEDRSLAPWVVSGMLVARSLLTMLSRAMLTYAARAFGRRRLMILSLALAAVSLAAMAFATQPLLLIALAGIYGLAIGISQPVTMSWLTDLSPTGQRGMTMSVRLAGNRIGQATLPVAVGILAGSTGVIGVLLATAVTLVIASWSSAAIDSEP